MTQFRRLFALNPGLLLMLLLAGCVMPVPSPAGQATAAATKAETPVTAGQAAVECKAGFRLFQHELLATEPVCIPVAPQHVLPLDMAALETLLITNQTPVGTAQWILEELPLLLPQYADRLAPLKGMGYPADLEQVAALKPDLILAPQDTIDVKLASAIAPVIVPKHVLYNDWTIVMKFWCDVLNVPELYPKLEANYKARVAELKSALGQPENLHVSIISASTYGVSLWMPDTPPGAILADVGLARPAAQSLVGDAAMARYKEKQYIQISEERLDLADGDALFYFTYAATDPKVADAESKFIKTFEQKPLWHALKAVKAGKAFFVPGYWWRSQTYLLANLVIDDLFTHLTDTRAKTPVLHLSK